MLPRKQSGRERVFSSSPVSGRRRGPNAPSFLPLAVLAFPFFGPCVCPSHRSKRKMFSRDTQRWRRIDFLFFLFATNRTRSPTASASNCLCPGSVAIAEGMFADFGQPLRAYYCPGNLLRCSCRFVKTSSHNGTTTNYNLFDIREAAALLMTGAREFFMMTSCLQKLRNRHSVASVGRNAPYTTSHTPVCRMDIILAVQTA
ncbi:hypothetical protein EJ05DRAFT_241152 [Pseudovirgaria hyperparasitica]|uniref:Uncharacterized protein n=1 Tax=Pseudovirgaria hyperparasitica TaxID=470096 RepID=A0A6A6WDT7_9PEZI|nr:uncharacterized protein EJ05DRAFT_241152 [Pseudovirgaria hyperparasitica]KAF2760735.1 hypothetical protein EJ05DRAFT_241152 [Pseudovirgaria hyperparasitica]